MNKYTLSMIWKESWKWIILDILSFILGIEAIIRTLYMSFTYTVTENADKSIYMFNLNFDFWDILRLAIGIYLFVSSIKSFKQYYNRYKELNIEQQ